MKMESRELGEKLVEEFVEMVADQFLVFSLPQRLVGRGGGWLWCLSGGAGNPRV